MATIFNYDPKYHNIFIYDREPGDLGERFSVDIGGVILPGQGGTLDLQLIPIRRNPSFENGGFDLSGVNYTFARPYAEGVFFKKRQLWDEDGKNLSDSSSTLVDFFKFPSGWDGMNLMISQYPFGFLLSRKHMLVPTKLLNLWIDRMNPRLMYDHPDIPYGSDGTVADKIFFMDNSGITYEMSVTDSNLNDNTIVGVHRIPRQEEIGSPWEPDLSGWSVLIFDSELPEDYKVYNNIIASDLPEGADIMIVFDNGKAIRRTYTGGDFDGFLRNIRTSSVMLQDFDDTSNFRDEGLIFVKHKVFGTSIYYKTLSGLEFTELDSTAPIENLSGSGYSTLIQFKSFFDIEGIDGIPPLTFWNSASFNEPFIIKTSFYGSDSSYSPPAKNPIYPVVVGVTATNVEDISIYKFSENSAIGDGSGFDYQPASPISFDIYPPTAQEKSSSDNRDVNTIDELRIYAYGSSGPVEQIREDIQIGSTLSNAMVQIGLDFLPYKRFPTPADFIDFKYKTEIFVDNQLHDTFVGRSDERITRNTTGEMDEYTPCEIEIGAAGNNTALNSDNIQSYTPPYMLFITGRFLGAEEDVTDDEYINATEEELSTTFENFLNERDENSRTRSTYLNEQTEGMILLDIEKPRNFVSLGDGVLSEEEITWFTQGIIKRINVIRSFLPNAKIGVWRFGEGSNGAIADRLQDHIDESVFAANVEYNGAKLFDVVDFISPVFYQYSAEDGASPQPIVYQRIVNGDRVQQAIEVTNAIFESFGGETKPIIPIISYQYEGGDNNNQRADIPNAAEILYSVENGFSDQFCIWFANNGELNNFDNLVIPLNNLVCPTGNLRDMPYVPRSYITGKLDEFGGLFTTRPTYYFDHKWIKNFTHQQAGKTLSVRFRCNFADGSNYDSGIVDVKQIEPEILSNPTFTSFIPENVDDGEGPSGQIGLPPFVGGLPETVNVTFGLNGLSSSPNIFDGDSENRTGSVCKFYVSKLRETGEFEYALLGEQYVTQDEVLNGFDFSIPNQIRFPSGTDPESLVGCELWVVYDLDHPAYLLSPNNLFTKFDTPLFVFDEIGSNAIVSLPYFLFESP